MVSLATKISNVDEVKFTYFFLPLFVPLESCLGAGVQPRLIQGIRSGEGFGEDQDIIASIRY